MKRSTTRSFSFLFAWLILLSSVSLFANIEDRVRKTFDVRPGGTLTLDTSGGSVDVKTVDGGGVMVEVIRIARTDNPIKAKEIFSETPLKFDQKGDDVRIDARRQSEWSFWRMSDRMRTRFQITVPKRYNVALTTSGGDIRVADLDGLSTCRTSGGNIVLGRMSREVVATTSGGNITVTSGGGPVLLKSSGGDIRIEDAGQRLTASTSGGSIDVGKVRGEATVRTSGGHISLGDINGTVVAESSGGNVTARIVSQPTGASRLTTSGGHVTVTLAGSLGFEVDASTSGGSVESDLPVTISGRLDRTSLRGKLNAGGPELYLRTSGGNIRLRRM